ncbi:MAG: hypothetical protein IBX55_01165 [Methyloprofundus sp.]|nr:hypothetical protein [Methyloprofundus sp.]
MSDNLNESNDNKVKSSLFGALRDKADSIMKSDEFGSALKKISGVANDLNDRVKSFDTEDNREKLSIAKNKGLTQIENMKEKVKGFIEERASKSRLSKDKTLQEDSEEEGKNHKY